MGHSLTRLKMPASSLKKGGGQWEQCPTVAIRNPAETHRSGENSFSWQPEQSEH